MIRRYRDPTDWNPENLMSADRSVEDAVPHQDSALPHEKYLETNGRGQTPKRRRFNQLILTSPVRRTTVALH